MPNGSNSYPLDELRKYKNGLAKKLGLDGKRIIEDLQEGKSIFAPVGSTYNIPQFQTLQDPIGLFVSVVLAKTLDFRSVFIYPKGAEGFKSKGVYNPEGLTGPDLVDRLVEFNKDSDEFGSKLLSILSKSIPGSDKRKTFKLINASSYLKIFGDPGEVLREIDNTFKKVNIKGPIVVRYGTPIIYEDGNVQVNISYEDQLRVEERKLLPNYDFTKGKTQQRVESELHITSGLLDIIVTHYYNLHKIFKELGKEDLNSMMEWLGEIPLKYNILNRVTSEIIENRLRKGVAFIPKGISFYAALISIKNRDDSPLKVDRIGITNYAIPKNTAELAKAFYEKGEVIIYPAIEVYIDNGDRTEKATTKRLIEIERKYGIGSVLNKDNYHSIKEQVKDAITKEWFREYGVIPIILKLHKS